MRGIICGMLDPFDPDSFIVRAEVHILGIEPKISAPSNCQSLST